MGWLGLKKRPDRDKDDEDQLRQEPAGPLQPLTPVLNLLVPDIAGVTSFRLRQFFNAEEARAFVETLPTTSGLHAFWGLHEPPPGHDDGESSGEAMVLIRSSDASDTVYVVSFVDLDSALSFAKFEVKRGMNLGLLLIYWAELVEVEADEHGIRFVPDVPPLPGFEARRFTGHWTDEPEAAAGEPATEAPVQAAEPAFQPPAVEPPAESVDTVPAEVIEMAEEELPAASSEPDWEPVSQTFEKETEEEFEQFVAEQEGLRTAAEEAPSVAEPEPAAAGAEPAAVYEEPAPATRPEPAAEEPGPLADQDDLPGTEPQLTPEEEMDIEREAIAFLKAAANGKKPKADTAPAIPDEVPATEPVPGPTGRPVPDPEPVIDEAEAETEPPSPAPVKEAPLRVPVSAQAQAPLHDHPAEEEVDSENLVEEVEKILKVKRWDKRESPFRGFDSPPGRF